MRSRRDKIGGAVGGANELASFLGHPGAKFFCGKLRKGRQKEKRSKKERTGSLVETAAAMEIPKDGIPTAAWKAQNAFHSSHKAGGGPIT
jgi:tRNA threonylcarbamoyladenosine modification (KEOPS) complex Cgi121 subunit